MLPYVGIGYLTFSMPVVFAWLVLNVKNIALRKDAFFPVIFLVLASISLLLSFIFVAQQVPSEDGLYDVLRANITNFGLMCLFVGYLIYFRFNKYLSLDAVERILKIYIVANALLALLFVIDHVMYFSVRSFWTAGADLAVSDTFSTITRFTGIFSDPNNLSVGVIAILAYLLMQSDRLSFVQVLAYTSLTLLVVVSTMSKTGFLSLIVLFAIYLSTQWRSQDFIKKKSALVLISLGAIGVVFIFGESFKVLSLALERFDSIVDDSRADKIAYYLNISNLWPHMFWGYGGTVIADGMVVRPHIGHFHIIYNYGLLAYAVFIYAFFRVRHGLAFVYYAPTLVILVGFSINTGFIDYRFSVLSALLISLYLRYAVSRVPLGDYDSSH